MRPTSRDTGAITSTFCRPSSFLALLMSTSLQIDTVDGSRTSPQTPSSTVNFTFVNQAEDLVSLCHRRISNKEQRHTIRSHVMQRVRQVESAQGKKRSTGREQSKKASKPKGRRKSMDSESVLSNDPKDNSANDSLNDAQRDRLSLSRSPRQSPRLYPSPAAHEFDPFDTLPTNTLPHQSSESLLQYCELVTCTDLWRCTINDVHRLRRYASADILC